MSTQAGRTRGKRKRKRARALERCILLVHDLNQQGVPVTSVTYRRAMSDFFKCITSTPLDNPNKGVSANIINKWVEEKIVYYCMPYLITVRTSFSANYSMDVQFIGAMYRDELIQVLSI